MLIGGRGDCCGLRRVVEPIVDVLFFVFLFVIDVKCAKDFAENVLVYVPVLTEVRSIIWRILETFFVDLFVLEVLFAYLDFVAGRLIGHFAWTPSSSLFVEVWISVVFALV